MSDVIDTGSKRDPQKSRTAISEALGERRKIERSEDELELGRFSGKTSRKSDGETRNRPRQDGPGEVVGAKREAIARAKPRPEQPKSDGDMRIAAPLTIDEGKSATRRRMLQRRSQPVSGSWWPCLALAAFGVVLLALTAAAFLQLPRYQPVGAPIIEPPGFDVGLTGWQRAGLISQDPAEPGQITLESLSVDAPTHLMRDIDLPPGDSLLMLRAKVRGQDVLAGSGLWDSARIYLVQLDADGEPVWSEEHHLFDLEGTTGTRQYSKAFSIPADIGTARIGIEMKNATGRLTVTDLELAETERPPVFVAAAGGLVVAWGVLLLATGLRTIRGIRSGWIQFVLALACSLSIAALLMPSSIYEEALGQFRGDLGIEDIDALGHGIIFAVLSFLVRVGRPVEPLWLHLGTWALVAVASEVLQLVTADREPSIEDLLVDGIGILIGLALAQTIRLMQRSPRA